MKEKELRVIAVLYQKRRDYMAKKNCEICGAEIGLLKQVQLAGGSYICNTNP